MASFYRCAPSGASIGRGNEPPRLLDRLRFVLRAKHYAYRTEQAYVHWVRRFILHHGKRHPQQMGGPESEAFLTHLAVTSRVSASTQTQALCAILFLYKHVLRIDLPHLDAVRAKRPKRLPVVLSRDEVRRLLGAIEGSHGVYRLMAGLMYGSGLRLMECCRLRVKDVDFDRRQIVVREAKGDKDRAVPLAAAACDPLRRPIAWRAELHEQDMSRGQGRVDSPTALERKYPNAAYEFDWQFVLSVLAEVLGGVLCKIPYRKVCSWGRSVAPSSGNDKLSARTVAVADRLNDVAVGLPQSDLVTRVSKQPRSVQADSSRTTSGHGARQREHSVIVVFQPPLVDADFEIATVGKDHRFIVVVVAIGIGQ